MFWASQNPESRVGEGVTEAGSGMAGAREESALARAAMGKAISVRVTE